MNLEKRPDKKINQKDYGLSSRKLLSLTLTFCLIYTQLPITKTYGLDDSFLDSTSSESTAETEGESTSTTSDSTSTTSESVEQAVETSTTNSSYTEESDKCSEDDIDCLCNKDDTISCFGYNDEFAENTDLQMKLQYALVIVANFFIFMTLINCPKGMLTPSSAFLTVGAILVLVGNVIALVNYKNVATRSLEHFIVNNSSSDDTSSDTTAESSSEDSSSSGTGDAEQSDYFNAMATKISEYKDTTVTLKNIMIAAFAIYAAAFVAAIIESYVLWAQKAPDSLQSLNQTPCNEKETPPSTTMFKFHNQFNNNPFFIVLGHLLTFVVPSTSQAADSTDETTSTDSSEEVTANTNPEEVCPTKEEGMTNQEFEEKLSSLSTQARRVCEELMEEEGASGYWNQATDGEKTKTVLLDFGGAGIAGGVGVGILARIIKAVPKQSQDKVKKFVNKLLGSPVTRAVLSGGLGAMAGVEAFKVMPERVEILEDREQLLLNVAESLNEESSTVIDPQWDSMLDSSLMDFALTRAEQSKLSMERNTCFTWTNGRYEMDAFCICKKQNNCAGAEMPEPSRVDFKLPSSTNETSAAATEFFGKLASGNFGSGTTSGNNFGRLAVKNLKDKAALLDKYKDTLKFKDGSNVNFQELESDLWGKMRKAFVKGIQKSGNLDNVLKSFGLTGLPEGSKNKKKDKKAKKGKAQTVADKVAPNGDDKTKKGKLMDFSFLDDNDKKSTTEVITEDLEQRPKLDSFEEEYNDIVDRSTEDIFKLLSIRYQRTAYPIFFEEGDY